VGRRLKHSAQSPPVADTRASLDFLARLKEIVAKNTFDIEMLNCA
jgi:hypothetical protein